MHCLWCHELIIPEVSWENIFIFKQQKQLCWSCVRTLEIIHGPRCRRCSRKNEETICGDCLQWQKRHDQLEFNYSVYTYNEQMQAMVTKWKYRGDYTLGNAFGQNFREIYTEVFSFLRGDVCVVPIPLSKDRMKERGFNQAKMLASFLPAMPYDVLRRTHSEKQSKKTRRERLAAANPFTLTKKVSKPVILIDDIYTTGTTLRHAAALLRRQGCPEIYAYTLIRG